MAVKIEELSEKYPFDYKTVMDVYCVLADIHKTEKFLKLASKCIGTINIYTLLRPLTHEKIAASLEGLKNAI